MLKIAVLQIIEVPVCFSIYGPYNLYFPFNVFTEVLCERFYDKVQQNLPKDLFLWSKSSKIYV